MTIFWHNIFSKEGPNGVKSRRYAVMQLSATIMLPAICVFVGCAPVVLELIARRTRLMEHPPEVDPRIIRDIYFGRNPKKLSFESDHTDNKNEASSEWRNKATDTL